MCKDSNVLSLAVLNPERLTIRFTRSITLRVFQGISETHTVTKQTCKTKPYSDFLYKLLGDSSEGVTPVPIPNTEVKPLSPDGTALVTVWESRTLPGLIKGLGPAKWDQGLCP